MTTASAVALGDIADLVRGITFKPDERVPVGTPDSVVCLRTANIQRDLDQSDLIAVPRSKVMRQEQVVRPGDILISSANSWNLVGKCVAVPDLEYQAAAGGFISILRPRRDVVDPRYLFRWLNDDRTQHTVRNLARQTTNIANLPAERFLALEPPLPDLTEQRRIAAMLDKADAVRRKRRESLRLLDEFLRSAFLEMFGDPVKNEKGWDRVRASSVIREIEPGSSVKGEERNQGPEEWAVLRISSVTSGWYLPIERKVVAAPPDQPVVPRRGDLLFSRANTRELVAATCLVDSDEPRLFLPDKLWRITPNIDLATVEYLRFLLADARFRQTLTRHATGTSGSMLNVSQEKLLHLDLPLPPLARQQQFGGVVSKVYEMRGRIRAAGDQAEQLFDSSAQRAFA